MCSALLQSCQKKRAFAGVSTDHSYLIWSRPLYEADFVSKLAAKPGGSPKVEGVPQEGENVKLVSEHVPTHLKPQTDEEFGHYLAGLIDGEGNFGVKSLVIAFNKLDASLAYYIKGRLGYGRVRKVKDKNASGGGNSLLGVLFFMTNREGLEKVMNLVNGKLRVSFKRDNFEKYILSYYKEPLNLKPKLHLNTSSDLENHWLAGFLDAGL